MKVLNVVLIFAFTVLSIGCISSGMLINSYSTGCDDRLDNYNYAICSIKKKDYVTAYKMIEDYFDGSNSTYSEKAINLAKKDIEILNAGFSTFSAKKYNQLLDQITQDNYISIKHYQSKRLSLFKYIASNDMYLEAKNNFDLFFSNIKFSELEKLAEAKEQEKKKQIEVQKLAKKENQKRHFIIKNFQLGMSEYDIKIREEQLKEQFYRKHPGIMRSFFPTITCTNYKNERSCFFYSTQLFDSSTEVNVSFLQDEAYRIKFTFSSYEYPFIKKGIVQKYGKPAISSLVEKRNAMNAKFFGRKDVWKKLSEELILNELAGKKKEGSLVIIKNSVIKDKFEEQMKSDTYKM